MDDRRFETLIRDAAGEAPPRVWSLLVTVFGELAQAPGARIHSPLLSRITGTLGIKPEAMRVALHRLRKDGWIESARVGRSSDYFLTEWGLAQCAEANPVIYADGPKPTSAWLLVCHASDRDEGNIPPGVWVSPNLLVSTETALGAECLALPLTPDVPLPTWMSDKICDPKAVAMAQDFAGRLATLQDALAPDIALSPLQEAALRVLVVHGWRRIVLRLPHLPPHLFPTDWQGELCRQRVRALLARLPHARLECLDPV